MATSKTRKEPNVLITGTPGTGKSTLAARLAQNLGFEFIDIGKEVKERSLFSEYDEQYKSHVLDEDKLLDFLEDRMNSDDGGVVLDYHSSEFFPQRWFDFVFVLRCENTEILYDRLASRNYSASKVRENVECEIFGTVGEEARDSYDPSTVYELASETLEQMASNISRATELISNWHKKNNIKKCLLCSATLGVRVELIGGWWMNIFAELGRPRIFKRYFLRGWINRLTTIFFKFFCDVYCALLLFLSKFKKTIHAKHAY